MFPGTFYLTKVDDKFRRFYKIKDPSPEERQKEATFNWPGDFKPQPIPVVDNTAVV